MPDDIALGFASKDGGNDVNEAPAVKGAKKAKGVRSKKVMADCGSEGSAVTPAPPHISMKMKAKDEGKGEDKASQRESKRIAQIDYRNREEVKEATRIKRNESAEERKSHATPAEKEAIKNKRKKRLGYENLRKKKLKASVSEPKTKRRNKLSDEQLKLKKRNRKKAD